MNQNHISPGLDCTIDPTHFDDSKRSAKKKPLSESFWAIKHTRGWTGFCWGTWGTRKDAIRDHISMIGGTWKQAYRHGDRAVRVTVTEVQHP